MPSKPLVRLGTVRAPDLRRHDGRCPHAIGVKIGVPYLRVFVYLIARGHKIVQEGAGISLSDELAQLADLKAKGVIDEAGSRAWTPSRSSASSLAHPATPNDRLLTDSARPG